MTNGLMQILRAQTQTEHQRLERISLSFVSSVDRAEYMAWVARLYGFVCPLENSLARVSGWNMIGIDFTGRCKASLLEKDLEALGACSVDIQRLPVCAELPDVSTMPRALGCMYVMEGATLGGRFIVGHLENMRSAVPRNAMAYHRSYGAAVPAMWRLLGERMESFVQSPDVEAEVVASARSCFSSLESWIASGPRARGTQ